MNNLVKYLYIYELCIFNVGVHEYLKYPLHVLSLRVCKCVMLLDIQVSLFSL